ncbi:MAG: efflux transporter outer membrane subunit [Verrucomicrobiales bacterium]
MRGLKSTALGLLFAVAASGCLKVGPDYQEPTALLAPQWIEFEDPNLNSTQEVMPYWWKRAFGDPVLDRLIDEALDQNLTLRSAGLRILQARQQLAIAIGNQYPQQQAATGQAEAVDEGGSGSAYSVYDFNFNLAWEVDVWGAFQRQIESASALLDASVADYDGIIVSLIAQVADTYVLIRTTEKRLAVARSNLGYQEESVRITEAKLDAGEVSPLDVHQAETLLYDTKASMIALEQSLSQSTNSLALLLGLPPRDIGARLSRNKPIPEVPASIDVGMPQDIIRRRPDIRLAERQLAAQSAQIGFALTELYPSLQLQGVIGPSVSTASGLGFNDLFRGENVGSSFAGIIDWNVFNYGRLKNNVRLQDATFQQLLVDYRQTVLEAQTEVENAIVAFFKSRQEMESLRTAAEAAKSASDISTDQYREGEIPFNTVITILSTLLSQQEQLAVAQGSVASNLIAVYKSLGGGWEVRKSDNPVDLIPAETQEEMSGRGKYWRKIFKERD